MLLRAVLLIGSGRLEEGRRLADAVDGADFSDTLQILATRGVLGADRKDLAGARDIAMELRRFAGSDSVPDILIARAQLAFGLGDREEAVRLIREAYRRGYAWRMFTHWIWPFERLRGWAPYDE